MSVPTLSFDEPSVRRRLVAFARRFVSDAHEAEDVAQETLLRARDGLGGLRQGERAEAWLFRICRHAAIDLVRARRVRRTVWGQQAPEVGESAAPTAAPWLLSGLESTLPDLGRLPAHQRVLLALHALGGQGQAALGRRSGLSAAALRVRLYRARRRLDGDSSSCADPRADTPCGPRSRGRTLPGAPTSAPRPESPSDSST